MWVLGVVGFAFLGYAVARQRQLTGGIAYGIGFWLIPTALCAVAFCWIFKAARAQRWQVFGVLYGCALAGHAISHQFQEQETLKAMDSIKASMTHYSEQQNLGGVPRPIELQSVTASAKGDIGVMEVLTKQFLSDATAQRNEYLAALEQAGWTRILDPERLERDPTMQESRAIVEASRAVVQQYREKATVLLDSLPERTRKAAFRSDAARRSFLQGAESSNARNRANNERNWNYEEAIVAEYAGVIELLAKIPGRYQFQDDGSVVFETNEAVEIYNGHLTKADELIKAQAKAMTQHQAAAMKRFDEARDKAAH